MKLLAVGQTWTTENGDKREILEIKITGAHCAVRYRYGREYVCHSYTFAAWVKNNNATTQVEIRTP
jgi:hypothetical protein